MSKSKNQQNSWGNHESIVTDRAADDLRRGLPVIVYDDKVACALIASETLTTHSHQEFLSKQTNNLDFGVLISKRRAETLKVPTKGREAILLCHDAAWSHKDIQTIADPTLDLSYPLKGPFAHQNRADTTAERAALKLLKIANLLPSGLALVDEKEQVEKIFGGEAVMSISAATIDKYDQLKFAEIEEVVRANVPLDGANNTTIVSFRSRSGGLENLAIIINDPDTSKPVLTRLHSECFTGDLLGSLKCDCGTQLKMSISEIEKAGSGVLLYLAQEGRGVGLSAKLKAYTLQEQGYDTVDANLRLGFEVDERIYAPAAKILKMLNINTVKLMTNNPKKVKALEGCGIKVAERVAHHFPTNKHNENYLETKKTKTGHLID